MLSGGQIAHPWPITATFEAKPRPPPASAMANLYYFSGGGVGGNGRRKHAALPRPRSGRQRQLSKYNGGGGALPEPLSLPSAPPPTCGRPRPVSSTSARNPTNSTSEKRNWRGHVPVDRPTALQTLGSCLTAYVPGFSDGQAHGRRAKVRCGRGALPARNPNPWGGGPWGWAKFNIAAVLTLSRNGGYQGTCGASAPQNKTHTHTHATSNA